MKDNARLRARYDALWTKCLRLRYEIAAQRCLLALDRMAEVVAKANFNPNQPRVPGGSPEGGEWTDTGAGGGGSNGESGRGGGSGSGGRHRPREGSRRHDEDMIPAAHVSKTPDMNAAIDHLTQNAEPESTENCAKYVRRALNAGGFDVRAPKSAYAKDFGPELEKVGFEPIAKGGGLSSATYPPPAYTPQVGDVGVIEPYPGGHPAGHMAMYNGRQWVSDFKQRTFYPGANYRKFQPSFVIYRYPNGSRQSKT